MSFRLFIKAVSVCAALSASVAFASDIEVSQPAVRAMPPGAPASGAYVTLTNHSAQERYLVGVESSVADTVEVHLSEMQGDTMKMYQVEQVPVPANGQAMLAPGSYHIMLIGLKQPLVAGDQVDFTLIMKNGERVAMQAPVLSPDDMAAYMPGNMSMEHDHMSDNHSNMHH